VTDSTERVGGPAPAERRWAVARIAVAQLQLIGAIVSAILLLCTGLSEFTVGAFTFMTVAFVAGRLLFDGR
jgi:hypothetical protein